MRNPSRNHTDPASGIRHPASGIRHPELIISYNILYGKGFLPLSRLFSLLFSGFKVRGRGVRKRYCGVIRTGDYWQGIFFLLAGLVCADAFAQGVPWYWQYAHCAINSFSPGSQTLYNFNPSAPSGTVYGSINSSLSGECHSTPGPYTNVLYANARSEPMLYSGSPLSNFSTGHLYVRVSYSGSAGGWSGWSNNSSGFPSQQIVDWKANSNAPVSSFSHNYSSQLTVQLVKYGSGTIQGLSAGSQISFQLVARARTFMSLHAQYWLDGMQGWRHDALWWSPDKPAIFTFNLASVMPPPQPPTCTTPAIPAQVMPAVNVNNFSGIGSVAGGKIFSLKYVNCNQQMVNIHFKGVPSGTSPDPSKGLLPSSPYTGVAVQMRHDLGSGGAYFIDFDFNPMVTYGLVQNGSSSYTVVMQARYYQIANVVTPGPVKASMTIVSTYT